MRQYLVFILIFISFSQVALANSNRVSAEISNDYAAFRYDFLIPKQIIHSYNEFSYIIKNNEQSENSYGFHVSTGLGIKELLNDYMLFHMGINAFYNSYDEELYGASIYSGISNSSLVNQGINFNTHYNVSPAVINSTQSVLINDIRGEVGYKISRHNNIYLGGRHLNTMEDFKADTITNHLYIGFAINF